MSTPAFDAFIAPWRHTFPVLALAELYASPGEAGRLLARAVLVLEWCDGVWRASDPRVTAAKLGWWAEEWERARRGDPCHPLGALLQPAAVSAPLANLLREADRSALQHWPDRQAAYAATGIEFAQAFAMADQDAAAMAACCTALIASRHLAAVAAQQPAALASLPLDARARHQLHAGSDDAARARAAAREGAAHVARALDDAIAALPAAAWSRQRGARVLAVMATRELRGFHHAPSLLSRWRDGLAAWRAARVVIG
jgi:hypothetical protein